jgi:hypothetical protein
MGWKCGERMKMKQMVKCAVTGIRIMMKKDKQMMKKDKQMMKKDKQMMKNHWMRK